MAVYTLKANIWLVGGGVLAIILLLATVSSFGNHSPASFITNAAQSLRHDPLDSIRNSTLGFQKIFVINLASRTDHRDAMALAAAVTDLHFDFMDGVTEVATKALPPGGSGEKLSKGELGNWRAHMNVAQHMVENNIASALVLEDDVDWDIRIKDQMQDFAKASRMLVQPLAGTTDQYLDPTYPAPGPDDEFTNFYVDNQQRTAKPTTSPYGDLDKWDMLWVGHCGTYFPEAKFHRPLGRAVILDDQTVPEPQHIEMLFSNGQLTKDYPPHTRIVSRAHQNICTFGYALSLKGAQRLLYELGVHHTDSPTDIALRSYCDADDRPTRVCLTVQPQLFQHHRPVGKKAAFSDIGFHGEDENKEAFTRNIRWSTRLNIPKLLEGNKDYIDLFKDGEDAKDWGFGKR